MSDYRCKWKFHDDEYGDYWETECGQSWCYNEGDLKDNGVKFCHSCGKEIKEVSDE